MWVKKKEKRFDRREFGKVICRGGFCCFGTFFFKSVLKYNLWGKKREHTNSRGREVRKIQSCCRFDIYIYIYLSL